VLITIVVIFGHYFVSRTNLMQAAVSHSPSTQVQKLSETDEHLNEDGRQSSHESDTVGN